MNPLKVQNTRDFVKSLHSILKAGEKEAPPIHATLILDGLPPAIGIIALETEQCDHGTFQPTDESILDKLLPREGILKVSGKTERLRVTNLYRCFRNPSHHFHFQFELIPEVQTPPFP